MIADDIRAQIDAMQARCDAAPPLPWRYREAAYGDPANGPDHTVLEAPYAEEWSVIARGDYDAWSGYGLGFAADARSDMPRLIAAVRAVLELHYPEPYAQEAWQCLGCGGLYPCRTVTAITTALGADHE